MWVYIYDVYRTITKPDFFDLVLYFQVTGGVLPFLSTMATQRVLPQSKETLLQSYNKRLKDDIKSILENFTEIIKTAKVCRANALSTAILFSNCVVYVTSLSSVRFSPTFGCSYTIEKKKNNMLFLQIEDETQVSRPTQAEQDHYEMHVRAANIVCICHNRLRGVKICFKISWNKLPTILHPTIISYLSFFVFIGSICICDHMVWKFAAAVDNVHKKRTAWQPFICWFSFDMSL